MLRDVFEVLQLLNLVLQMVDGSLCLADIPLYLNKTLQELKKLQNSDCCKWCQEKKFNELKTLANNEVLNMPPSANLCNANQFDFDSFIQITYMLFIERFTEEITEAFEQLDFSLSFVIFGSGKLPTDEEDFTEYGMSELDMARISFCHVRMKKVAPTQDQCQTSKSKHSRGLISCTK